MLSERQTEIVHKALDVLQIELPSWGFANTGTRFGKFIQAAAATSADEKFSDAGQVHKFTGCCPTVAVHVLWDFPKGLKDARAAEGDGATSTACAIGAINPNVFQDQMLQARLAGQSRPGLAQGCPRPHLDCVEIAKQASSRDISLWFADGSSYPGHRRTSVTASSGSSRVCSRPTTRSRPACGCWSSTSPSSPPSITPTSPIGACRSSCSKAAGPQAKVLVDTGHHYQAQNIEQIVAWLLAEDMLGGFHFNDRRYADDDLTLGSIDPYQVFRIFHEIALFEFETGKRADIAYMVDQSHNLKSKIEEMIQTVMTAQELYAKAALVDHAKLIGHQNRADLVDAEECLKAAFNADVRPAIAEWRKSKGLAAEPLQAFRASGYLERITKERSARNKGAVASYA